MATVVIMPGGFHPPHAGHMALYNSIKRTFPDAEIFVASTDDTSQRPFPFKIKEKLAYLAGVEPGHFVQVKSPFRANEITSRFNPEKDVLIFVRSTKDAKEPPHAGGVLKSGKPAYLQPLLGAKELEPFAKHAYMAYLPTVEFGPGITSASEIRAAWPGLDDRRKTAMVMSLYPKTQGNPKLAATVVKMLDTAIGSELDEGWREKLAGAGLAGAMALGAGAAQADTYHAGPLSIGSDAGGTTMTYNMGDTTAKMQQAPNGVKTISAVGPGAGAVTSLDASANRLGVDPAKVKASLPKQGVKERHTVGYIQERDKPKHVEPEVNKDPELKAAKLFAKQHYNQFGGDPEEAYDKWVQRSLKHSEENDAKHDKLINFLTDKIIRLEREVNQVQQQPTNEDYVEEKWSQKYKRSIDCSHPRGFSQRAHCAGRKK